MNNKKNCMYPVGADLRVCPQPYDRKKPKINIDLTSRRAHPEKSGRPYCENEKINSENISSPLKRDSEDSA